MNTMDEIRIRGLEVFARHGVNAAETALGQKFRVNAVVHTDIHPAAAGDDILQTVDYGKLCRFITDFMRQNTYKLIETAAERLAEAVLTDFDRTGAIRRIDLEIEKPWAPIGLPLERVSVKISRAWETVYLSVGSNLGDKRAYLDRAAAALEARADIRGMACSQWIETAPYGPVAQDPFLNGVIRLETFLSPHALLDVLHEIENAAGRERKVHWGPRTLDLDILFYGDLVMADETLILPHPDLENRAFVLEPLKQISPYVRHPVSKKTAQQLLTQLREKNSAGAAAMEGI